jgi:hypothetical protein
MTGTGEGNGHRVLKTHFFFRFAARAAMIGPFSRRWAIAALR